MRKRSAPVALLLIALIASSAAAAPKGMVAGAGTEVSVEYTLWECTKPVDAKGVCTAKGEAIETNAGKDALVYSHGSGQVMPGFENAIAGLRKGDEKDFTLLPEDAYGKTDARALQEIPKAKIPTEAHVVGAVLEARSPEGKRMPVKVAEVKKDVVVLDFNHPMAGKTLTFHVKVLEVKKAEPPAPGDGPAAAPGSPGTTAN
jgi:FKBP-type peptidyl-prolyl cis-trans isomerase 2